MLLCPSCNKPVAPEDVNIPADVAMCRACNQTFAISHIVHGVAQQRAVFDSAAPALGTWMRNDGVETVIGASTRSPAAFFLVPFMVVWTGLSVGLIYGSQIISGKFNLLTSLFGVPFLLASALFWSLAILLIAGRVEVCLRSGEGRIITGVGPFVWTRRFLISEITTIREDWSGYSTNRQPRRSIVLEGARRISFGSVLNDSRRYFVLQSLKSVLKLPR